MSSTQKQARVAGLLYFVGCITAPFSLLYVPRTLMVPGDATATADRIRTSETLLRLGLASELFCSTFLILAVLALYQLFKKVDDKQALAMLALLLVSVPISLLTVLNEIATLILVSGAPSRRPCSPWAARSSPGSSCAVGWFPSHWLGWASSRRYCWSLAFPCSSRKSSPTP